jgi:dTDP-4-dehydrorhamnose reductase
VRKRILFTGGSGLLALNSALYLRNDFEVYLGLHSRIINLEGVNTCLIDLGNEQALERELIRIKPDILINAAGMTNVEECELKPNEANNINAIVPGVLARLSKKLNIYYVHISTDHLFDGTKTFQTEEDIISPLNVYGKSKAKGEQEVLINNNEALIVRTNFFGWGTSYRQSFSDFIIYNLRNQKIIEIFEDVFFTPISIKYLIRAILDLIEIKAFGVFNIVSDESLTKYDFALNISEHFKLNQSLIKKIKFNDKKLTIRPLDLCLSSKKIKNTINYTIPKLNDQILQLFNEENSFKNELIKL